MIERRRFKRIPAALPARIVFNYRSVLACTLRDVSAAGAGLEVDAGAAIPDRFDLISVDGDDAHTCRLVWRAKDRMGVAFN